MFQREDNSLCHVKPENDPASLCQATAGQAGQKTTGHGEGKKVKVQTIKVLA